MPSSPPTRPDPRVEQVLRETFARLDPLALGAAIGLAGGLLLFAATNLLILKGGDPVGPTLALLNHYLPGYTVTFGGSLLGLGYAGATGFMVGWSLAVLYNGLMACYLYLLRFKANLARLTDFLDPDHAS